MTMINIINLWIFDDKNINWQNYIHRIRYEFIIKIVKTSPHNNNKREGIKYCFGGTSGYNWLYNSLNKYKDKESPVVSRKKPDKKDSHQYGTHRLLNHFTGLTIYSALHKPHLGEGRDTIIIKKTTRHNNHSWHPYRIQLRTISGGLVRIDKMH